jgi:tubulin polyglutamylase TTLL6/13
MWEGIKDVIVKTMIAGQPNMAHLFKTCKTDDIENSISFQILGFDVIFDHKLKCGLIEVNQSPSFQTDTPLDYDIKS